jgi:hypothetical protein
MSEQPGHYWRGPIQSAEHAKKIVGLTAGAFAVFAGLDALTLFNRASVSTVVTVLLLGLPALALLRTRGIIAARILLGLSIISAILSALVAVYNGASAGMPNIGVFFMLVVGLFWTAVSFGCARACKAAKYLRSAPEPTAVAELNA